jgi:hypothetical protein
MLDTVTLIRSALDDEREGWLKESASVTQLWHASIMAVTMLEDAFLPGGVTDRGAPPDAQTVARWQQC